MLGMVRRGVPSRTVPSGYGPEGPRRRLDPIASATTAAAPPRARTARTAGSRPATVPAGEPGLGVPVGLASGVADVAGVALASLDAGGSEAEAEPSGLGTALGAADGSRLGALVGVALAPGDAVAPVGTIAVVKCFQRYSRVVRPEAWTAAARSRPR